MKTLVTGGTGMVGHAMNSLFPDFSYPSSKSWDLTSPIWAEKMMIHEWPDRVIHLAAKVGGVQGNTKCIGDFYYENMMINSNVVEACKLVKVKKLVSLLSTCVYPDAPYVKYPLTEDQLHMGPPHSSNYGYAYAKRMLDVQSRAYRQQYGCNFITAIPNNLYGEYDNFDLENGHVIPALIRKIWEAKIRNLPRVEVWGDGSPLREFTYSGDVAKILVWLMDHYDGEEPVNIGSTTEISIKELVEKIRLYII
jgi:GDP-L-fucose synthase